MVEGFEVHGVPYHETRRESTDPQKYNPHDRPTEYHPTRSDYYEEYDYDEDRFESRPRSGDRSSSRYKSTEETEAAHKRRKDSGRRREGTRTEGEQSRQHHRLDQEDSPPSRSSLKSSQNFRYV